MLEASNQKHQLVTQELTRQREAVDEMREHTEATWRERLSTADTERCGAREEAAALRVERTEAEARIRELEGAASRDAELQDELSRELTQLAGALADRDQEVRRCVP